MNPYDAIGNAAKHGASVYQWTQGMWVFLTSKEQEQSGCCLALAYFWIIKDAHNERWDHDSQQPDDPMRIWIADVQSTLERLKPADQWYVEKNFLSKRGLFPLTDPNQARTTISSLHPQARDKVCDAILAHQGYSLVHFTLRDRPGAAHQIAAKRDQQGVSLFDPNGGVARFSDTGRFRTWFTGCFLDADPNHLAQTFYLSFWTYGIPVQRSH